MAKITFREALRAELKKSEPTMTEKQLDIWVDKTRLGKAVMAAYKVVHG